MKIYIVDDDEQIIDLMAKLLLAAGHRVSSNTVGELPHDIVAQADGMKLHAADQKAPAFFVERREKLDFRQQVMR